MAGLSPLFQRRSDGSLSYKGRLAFPPRFQRRSDGPPSSLMEMRGRSSPPPFSERRGGWPSIEVRGLSSPPPSLQGRGGWPSPSLSEVRGHSSPLPFSERRGGWPSPSLAEMERSERRLFSTSFIGEKGLLAFPLFRLFSTSCLAEKGWLAFPLSFREGVMALFHRKGDWHSPPRFQRRRDGSLSTKG